MKADYTVRIDVTEENIEVDCIFYLHLSVRRLYIDLHTAHAVWNFGDAIKISFTGKIVHQYFDNLTNIDFM